MPVVLKRCSSNRDALVTKADLWHIIYEYYTVYLLLIAKSLSWSYLVLKKEHVVHLLLL